jgi:plasmid stabilization system protein ParE
VSHTVYPGAARDKPGSARLSVSRFPYSVIYRPLDDGIRVLVVHHQSRDPGYGDERE